MEDKLCKKDLTFTIERNDGTTYDHLLRLKGMELSKAQSEIDDFPNQLPSGYMICGYYWC